MLPGKSTAAFSAAIAYDEVATIAAVASNNMTCPVRPRTAHPRRPLFSALNMTIYRKKFDEWKSGRAAICTIRARPILVSRVKIAREK
jgi:hypothetical protein